ncbi:ATP phosphoribosyltransferase regulatory subunit [Paraconexibacter antarcticus]|uniref:ATP phosphoribosyltransferase regulatory subunit n=1 Tax=Paraconexibacter antarcticus TaxID=2949664 RepID=A0ABY5DMR8_9ACTN|nr:ATP phosphoribosyltransferase regulatory subunit [Paraconexibacter antarcticus]UTI62906.1 ATP phosphoribosyltransferase regulatory subunit [Paraconexibacter antarcticus]
MTAMYPTPSGTRDVLPDEMRELRAITDAIRTVFEDHGYGEVWTPAIEFESAVDRMGGSGGGYRLFDDHGSVLCLRSDLTVPIARVAATRYATAEPPLRFSSFAHVYRGVKPGRGQMRETLQAGVELIGAAGPEGTAEVLTVLCRALEAAGLREYRIGIGDAGLYSALLAECGVDDARSARILDALVGRDLVRLSVEVHDAGLDAESTELLTTIPLLRGGAELLDTVSERVATERLRAVHGAVSREVAERLIFDLGLVRDLDYYTGAVFEIYDPAAGMPLGGGGRYDDLVGRFGRDMPAVGFSFDLNGVHIALAGEQRGEGVA